MIKYGFFLSLLLLAGCASPHSCGQFPQSGCQPVSSVNERTNGEIYDYRKDFNNVKKSKSSDVIEIKVGQSPNALNYAAPGDVILTKPLVLRVLVNVWEDQEKNLHGGGYVFVRVKESEWTFKN